MTRRPTLRLERVADPRAGYEDEPRLVRVFAVYAGDDRYEFADFRTAKAALAAVTSAHDDGRAVSPCSWLVDRYHPEPDSPADLVGPCGAPLFEDDDGRGIHCLAGHAHRSDVEYYEADEVRSFTERGIPLAANAALMDGRPVEAAW